MKDFKEFISKVDMFFGLSAKEREQLLVSAEERDVRRKETLFKEKAPANTLYVVSRGSIKTVRGYNSDQRLLVDFLKPGDILGEESVLLSGEYELDAIPFDLSTVLCIPAENVKKTLGSQPKLGRAMASLAASRARSYRERLYSMTTTPVPIRLAQTLHMLAKRFGKRDKQGTLIALRVTHQDIADYIGASRETVSLFLSKFRKQRLITMNVRKIIIPDMKTLKKAARG